MDPQSGNVIAFEPIVDDPDTLLMGRVGAEHRDKKYINKDELRTYTRGLRRISPRQWEELNPQALTAPERRRLRSMMRRLGVPAVVMSVDPASSRDIAIYLGTPPKIVAGRKWLAAPFHERMKRCLHELCHTMGMRHDAKARHMGYYSNPGRDTYSAWLYRMLGGSRG